MNIKDKLKYILEGYSFETMINENTFNTKIHFHDFGHLFLESFSNDINFILESDVVNSKKRFLDYVKNIFKWLKDKILQFIKFIKNRFFNFKKENKKKKVNGSKKLINPPKYEEDDTVADINQEESFIRYNSGALEYVPEDEKITLFAHIFDRDNFIEYGFMKVYKVISEYIEKLEKNPIKHEEILPTNNLLINKKQFMNKIFKKALSVEYDKKEIFKKIYGDMVSKNATTKLILNLGKKLEQIDNECEIFANWIQNTLPNNLNKIQSEFENHIKRIETSMSSKKFEDVDSDRKMIETLNTCLSKIIKLIEMQMSIIQVFATMHAEVFMHLKTEYDSFNWVFEDNSDYDDFSYYDYDNGGLVH